MSLSSSDNYSSMSHPPLPAPGKLYARAEDYNIAACFMCAEILNASGVETALTQENINENWDNNFLIFL